MKTGREKRHILTLIFYILYYVEKRYRRRRANRWVQGNRRLKRVGRAALPCETATRKLPHRAGSSLVFSDDLEEWGREVVLGGKHKGRGCMYTYSTVRQLYPK